MAEDYMALYKKALEGLSTGGMTLKASLQEIEEGKQQAIGRGQQSMVSSGLAGTTVMGGIPLQAEKIASRQRLGARGRAEEKYLTTLASFSAFAQRGQEAEKERTAALERQRLASQTQLGAAQWGFAASRGGGGGGSNLGKTFGIGSDWSWGDDPTKKSNAQQFPSIYGEGGEPFTPTPDWMGGGTQTTTAEAEPPVNVGSVPYGARTGPTAEEPGDIRQGMWFNYITGERAYGAQMPTGGYAPSGWMWQGG